MKKTLLTVLCSFLLIAFSNLAFSFDNSGKNEFTTINSDKAVVFIDESNQTMTIVFDDISSVDYHSVLDLDRMDNDLKYKTRLMQYFGGMLIAQKGKLKELHVQSNGEQFKFSFDREHISKVVNMMVNRGE